MTYNSLSAGLETLPIYTTSMQLSYQHIQGQHTYDYLLFLPFSLCDIVVSCLHLVCLGRVSALLLHNLKPYYKSKHLSFEHRVSFSSLQKTVHTNIKATCAHVWARTVHFYHTEYIFLCLSKCRHDTFPCVYLGAHSELFMPILEHRINSLVLMSLNIWVLPGEHRE